MVDRAKLALRFDPKRLQEDLLKLSGIDWIEHFVKRNYEGEWNVIPLRGPAGAEHPVMMIYSDPTCTEFADTRFLGTCPYFQDVLATFQCELGAVRLMKLAPGSRIKEHRDYDLDPEHGHVRLHIPVVTNPDVEFLLNGNRVSMNPGECWYLRLSDPHRVANRGTTDRVHMVVDAAVNSWLKNQLSQAGLERTSPRR